MSDAQSVTTALGGRWHGRYGTACCPAHQDRSPSLSLADGAGGRLLVRCFAGCDGRRVLDALRARGLLPGRGMWTPPGPFAESQRLADERADLLKRSRQARECWDAAGPIRGTPAEAYLRARGITLDVPPVSLRFHPACWHSSGRRLPALVAAVQGGQAFALHRTYLDPDGACKAAVEPVKVSLGPAGGGAVRLSAARGPLVVAEGIETTPAAGILLGRPAHLWAALSAPGMAALNLPPLVGELILAVDSDDNGAGAAARRALGERAHKAGWLVSWWPAPPGKDWNDVLQAERAETASA